MSASTSDKLVRKNPRGSEVTTSVAAGSRGRRTALAWQMQRARGLWKDPDGSEDGVTLELRVTCPAIPWVGSFDLHVAFRC